MPFFLVGGLNYVCQSMPKLQLFVIILGEGLWVITYMLIIREAFRAHTYGIPLIATALNCTWEVLYCLLFPSSCWVVRLLRYAWIILDAVIVWQLIRYGRKEQKIPDFRQHFYIAMFLIFLMAGIGHWTFSRAFQDLGGEEAAFSINLIMSFLFVLLFYSRKHAYGLSYGAAWTKMLGTGILSLATAISFMSHPVPTQDFMLFLFASIFLFDILYIVLWHRLRSTVSAHSCLAT